MTGFEPACPKSLIYSQVGQPTAQHPRGVCFYVILLFWFCQVWSPQRDSNSRRLVPKTNALPLSYGGVWQAIQVSISFLEGWSFSCFLYTNDLCCCSFAGRAGAYFALPVSAAVFVSLPRPLLLTCRLLSRFSRRRCFFVLSLRPGLNGWPFALQANALPTELQRVSWSFLLFRVLRPTFVACFC